MKYFGKFEKDENSRVYRTRTFVCLDGSSQSIEPNVTEIIGTIFMLNPGSSRPLNSEPNSPFEGYAFNQYTDLETDETMNVFIDIFSKLQGNKKFTKGIVEIKNLFNYREGTLTNDDWKFITDDIKKDINHLNINSSPTFYGEFIFFAWGTSKLINSEIKSYSQQIFNKSKKDNMNILYISPKPEVESEKHLSFYHPLGGHWKADKRERFNNSIFETFNSLQAQINFE
ncbi:MAG: hypothetical protein WC667_13080 [Sulfurimonas sp.]|jgi:hypothetical protein